MLCVCQNADFPSTSVVYQVIPEPIPDISFLGKKASTMCQNIPTYHAVPDCGKAVDNYIASSVQNSELVLMFIVLLNKNVSVVLHAAHRVLQ